MVLSKITIILLLQFFIGYGFKHLFLKRIKINLVQNFALFFILGIGISSLIPFLLELIFIKINFISIITSLFVLSIIFNVKNYKKLKNLKEVFFIKNYSVRLYEWIFILFIVFLLLISIWRCFYLPPTPRDVLSGPEPIAHFSLEEGKISSSVWSINLESTNNHQKPPFIFSMQIIFESAGLEFGQIWLSVLIVLFIIFLYNALKGKTNPIIAGFLIVLLLAIPEMYGYTFMMLFDYPNAVFFTIGVYLLNKFLENKDKQYLILSSIIFAISTYVRSETIFFIIIGAGVIFVSKIKRDHKKKIFNLLILIIPSIIIYILWHNLYLKYYIIHDNFNVENLINPTIWEVTNLFSKFSEINNMIFSDFGVGLYNYFIYFFIIIFILNTIFYRRFKMNYYFVWICTLYLGYAIMAHILPLVVINMTVKRGFFKLFPIMILYLAETKILVKLSSYLKE